MHALVQSSVQLDKSHPPYPKESLLQQLAAGAAVGDHFFYVLGNQLHPVAIRNRAGYGSHVYKVGGSGGHLFEPHRPVS